MLGVTIGLLAAASPGTARSSVAARAAGNPRAALSGWFISQSTTRPTRQALFGLPDGTDEAAIILEAEDRRELSAELLALAASTSAELRGRVALAIGRIGHPAGLEPLLSLVADSAEGVRALAAFGLGALEYDLDDGARGSDPAVAALSAILAAPVSSETGLLSPRAMAAAALGRIGGAEAATALGSFLTERAASTVADAHAAVATEMALAAYATLPGAQPRLIMAFTGAPEGRVRLAAAQALASLRDPNAQPPLLPLLDDSDPAVRAAALAGLRSAPLSVAQVHAIRMLADRDVDVVVNALDWIREAWRVAVEPETAGGAIEINSNAVTSVLRRSLDRDLTVRRAALGALGALGGSRSVAIDRLVDALEEEESSVRAAALQQLAASNPGSRSRALAWVLDNYEHAPERIGSSLEAQAVMRLVSSTHGSDSDAARAWIRQLALDALPSQPDAALGAIVPPRSVASPPSDSRLSPVSAHVRAAAIRAWIELEPSSAVAAALVALESANPAVRAAAGEALASLSRSARLPQLAGGDGWGQALWRLQLANRAAGHLSPRLALLETLSRADPGLFALRAQILLRDPERVVRLWALRALAGADSSTRLPQGEPTGVARDFAFAASGSETGRSAADYRGIAERLQSWSAQPLELALATPRGEVVLELRPAWAPLTVTALLEWLDVAAQSTLAVEAGVGRQTSLRWDLSAGVPLLRSEELPPGLAAIAAESLPVSTDRGGNGPQGLGLAQPQPPTTMAMSSARRDAGGREWVLGNAKSVDTNAAAVVGIVVAGHRALARLQPGDVVSVRVVKVDASEPSARREGEPGA